MGFRVARRMFPLKVEALVRATGRHQAVAWPGTSRREATGLRDTVAVRDSSPEATVKLLGLVAIVEPPTEVHSRQCRQREATVKLLVVVAMVEHHTVVRSRQDPHPEVTGKAVATEDPRALGTAELQAMAEALEQRAEH